MKQTKKTAAEAEPESHRCFWLILQGRVIQLKLFQSIPQIRVFRPVRRIHAAEYHGVYFFITGQRFRTGVLCIRHRIAHRRILHIFNRSCNISYHAGRQFLTGNKLPRPEITHFHDFRLCPCGHHQDFCSFFHPAFLDAAEYNNPFVGIIQRVEDQCLQGIVRAAGRSRYLLYHRFQHLFDADPVLCGNHRRILCLQPDHVFDFILYPLGLGAGKINLVDHRKDIQIMIQRQIYISQSLGFDPLGGIHHQDRPVTGRQASAHFIIKIHMPRRIDQVQDILFPVICPVNDADGLGLDRNAPLPFQIHIVQHLGLHLPARQKARFFYNTIRQRGFPMVNMRYNAKISYFTLIYTRHLFPP